MNVTTPVRLQLSRKKGFRLVSPNGLPIVKVCRPSKWGNPFALEDLRKIKPGESDRELRERAVLAYTQYLPNELAAAARRELAGKNLVCWCPLDQPCHADVLLRVAND